MNIHCRLRSCIITLSAILIGASISFAQSNSSMQPIHKVYVEKEISQDEFTLTFQNVIGKNQADFEQFEDKTRKANFQGLIKVEINPKSKQMIVVFSSQIKTNDLKVFLKP